MGRSTAGWQQRPPGPLVGEWATARATRAARRLARTAQPLGVVVPVSVRVFAAFAWRHALPVVRGRPELIARSATGLEDHALSG